MNENYTAEDFAKARFAEHPDTGQTACRIAGADGSAWTTEDGADATDASMARDRWVPVVEATEVMQNRQVDAEAHLEQIGRLSKRLAAAGERIERQRLALDDFREENYRLQRILQTPLSLKDLGVAWEAAEEADTCNAGDVLITRYAPEGSFEIGPAKSRGCINSGVTRILSRAPREPWVELAGVLHDVINQGGDDRIDVDSAAARLYAEGVRVTGGEES